jgi:hypothetical protein
MQKTIYLLFLVSLSMCLLGCNKDDDNTKTLLNTNIIGVYMVNSIKSDTNLRTGGYIGSGTELIPHFTCDDITLEIKSDFTFIWNAQKIYQDFVYNNDVITSSSDLQCTALTVNGTVTATTDTSITLQFTHNNTQETAVFNLVNDAWLYQSTQDVFFQGHATLVDGVDTLYTDAILTMVYEIL